MRSHIHAAALTLCTLITVPGFASSQPARSTQPVPEPRPLGPIVARSSQTFVNVSRMVVAGGSVFINDSPSRQVWMLDSSLSSAKLVLDSTSGLGLANWYGEFGTPASLRRFRGDSVFFSRATSVEAIIIGPDGKIARVAAMPQGTGCTALDMDDTGWITCQVAPRAPVIPPPPAREVLAGRDSVIRLKGGDSAAIAAVSFKTWDVDTIGRLLIAPQERQITYRETGGVSLQTVGQPVYLADMWTVFRDGTLAIARATDYHLDIVDIRGGVTRGARAPFNWRRLTDADKDGILDSLQRMDSVAQVRADSARAAIAARNGTPIVGSLPGGPLRASPDDWPSYWPPFATTSSVTSPSMMADEDGRVWVREALPRGADSVRVYGVFDKKGQFLERIKIPLTHTLVGFGPGGSVYLTTSEAGRTTVLRARFAAPH